MSIGGATATERNFVIQVVGQHHSGVLKEIMNAIHGEGMDVLECRVETDGDMDSSYFVVQSRGKQKDFDDEKLEDIRHHIQEILGDTKGVVMFEAVADEMIEFAAIELQVVSQVKAPDGVLVSLITKKLQELGLDVEEIDEQHKLQTDHGHQTELERDLFYAVPSQNSDEQTITHTRVYQIKLALQKLLDQSEHDLVCEVVAKPVADRSKGFSELQTFDVQQAIARAKGTVWELLCFGPHNVELLSEATRQLAPLGVQLLHAAHSHAARPTKGVAKGGEVAAQTEQCSCIFIDKPGKRPSADEVAEFTKKVLHVLMTTYGSKDEANFTVRPVDSKELQELAAIASVTSQAEVPGVGSFTKPRSASFARRTGKATNAITMNLKEIPTSPGGQRRPSEVGRRPSRASFGPAAAADQPMQFLEC
uniref:ACT domain-containing protein n=1 Tax=Haptolina ericina TaxID=156174 RepID=A0A7S3AJY0_9EUKA